MSITGHGQLLCVWSLEEFLRRLSEIRDLYQEASESGAGFEGIRQALAANPFQNPWHQTTFADVKLLAEAAASIRSNPILRWLLRCPNISVATPGREAREQLSPSSTCAMPSPAQAQMQEQGKASSLLTASRQRPSPLSSPSSTCTSDRAVQTSPKNKKAGSRPLSGSDAASEGRRFSGSSGRRTQESEASPPPEVIYEPPSAIRSELASAVLSSVLGETCSMSSAQDAVPRSPSEACAAGQRNQDGLQGFREELAQLRDLLTTHQASGSSTERVARLEQLLLEKLRVSLAETVRGELRSILVESSGEPENIQSQPEPVASSMLHNDVKCKSFGVRSRSPFPARREDAAAGPTLLGNEGQGSGGYAKAEPIAGSSPPPLRRIHVSAQSGNRSLNSAKGFPPGQPVRHIIIRAPNQHAAATRSISPVPGRQESCTLTSRTSVSPPPRSISPLGPRRPMAATLSGCWGKVGGSRTPQTGWSTFMGIRAPPSPGPRPRILQVSSSAGQLPCCAEPVSKEQLSPSLP